MSGKETVNVNAQAAGQRDKFISQIRNYAMKTAKLLPENSECIVATLGGYWPSAEDVEDGDDIEPYIVMERMTHNLRQVLGMQLLDTPEKKRLVLLDIIAGIAYLHDRKIVHRDIKPENVPLRVVDGKIVGPAKVCDFSVSRKAQQTNMATTSMRTSAGLAGTLAYMPPEVFGGSTRQANMPARDVWSFGVLMCEVLEPNFLMNLVGDHPDGLNSLAGRTDFAEKIVERARNISCVGDLGRIVNFCLFLDPALRPRIEYISARIANVVPVFQFRFETYYSLDYKVNAVLRCVRNVFAVRAERNNIETAISVLKQAAQENSDLPAQSVLGYCHYYGIGVGRNKKKGIELFQKGCNAGDCLGTYARGVVHYRSGTYDTAVSLLTKAAEMGSGQASRRLAYCYQYGNGVEKDEKRAFQLMSSAVEAGNGHAEENLAYYFREGIGTKKDERKGIAMAERLSASGNGWASMRLAVLYKIGYGVQKDEEKAKKFEALARNRGIDGEWVINEKDKCWEVVVK